MDLRAKLFTLTDSFTTIKELPEQENQGKLAASMLYSIPQPPFPHDEHGRATTQTRDENKRPVVLEAEFLCYGSFDKGQVDDGLKIT